MLMDWMMCLLMNWMVSLYVTAAVTAPKVMSKVVPGAKAIELRFSARTDMEVRNVILAHDLEILPIFMNFDSHAQISFPLDQVDPKAVAGWIDDRILGFVKTYLSLHENDKYLKDVMVDDPVANVRFPKFATGAKLEHEGKTYYFIGQETCDEFVRLKVAKTK